MKKNISWLTALVSAGLMSLPALASAANLERYDFGKLESGASVEAIKLSNTKGMSVVVITLGAGLQSVMLPDAQGKSADILLGFNSPEGYLKHLSYFGGSVGRFANRIARGQFVLDGKTYQVPVNDGVNSLHGGDLGFDRVIWKVLKTSSGKNASVELQYVSPNGDMGYPGKMDARVTYSLNDNNELSITYGATTDAPTVVNITSHGYWNLAGEGSHRSINEQLLQIHADAYLPVDSGAIPSGEIRKVEGTVFDFRKPTAIGLRVRDASEEQIRFGKGYDHNWVVSMDPVKKVREVACAMDPVSGRGFKLLSDQPGLQFYSGNFLDATVIGKAGSLYRQGDAFVLEPQLFPDAPNQPTFHTSRLNPGEHYSNRIVFAFSSNAKCEN